MAKMSKRLGNLREKFLQEEWNKLYLDILKDITDPTQKRLVYFLLENNDQKDAANFILKLVQIFSITGERLPPARVCLKIGHLAAEKQKEINRSFTPEIRQKARAKAGKVYKTELKKMERDCIMKFNNAVFVEASSSAQPGNVASAEVPSSTQLPPLADNGELMRGIMAAEEGKTDSEKNQKLPMAPKDWLPQPC